MTDNLIRALSHSSYHKFFDKKQRMFKKNKLLNYAYDDCDDGGLLYNRQYCDGIELQFIVKAFVFLFHKKTRITIR